QSSRSPGGDSAPRSASSSQSSGGNSRSFTPTPRGNQSVEVPSPANQSRSSDNSSRVSAFRGQSFDARQADVGSPNFDRRADSYRPPPSQNAPATNDSRLSAALGFTRWQNQLSRPQQQPSSDATQLGRNETRTTDQQSRDQRFADDRASRVTNDRIRDFLQ